MYLLYLITNFNLTFKYKNKVFFILNTKFIVYNIKNKILKVILCKGINIIKLDNKS